MKPNYSRYLNTYKALVGRVLSLFLLQLDAVRCSGSAQSAGIEVPERPRSRVSLPIKDRPGVAVVTVAVRPAIPIQRPSTPPAHAIIQWVFSTRPSTQADRLPRSVQAFGSSGVISSCTAPPNGLRQSTKCSSDSCRSRIMDWPCGLLA